MRVFTSGSSSEQSRISSDKIVGSGFRGAFAGSPQRDYPLTVAETLYYQKGEDTFVL
jgi:hypothetical protein